MMRATFVDKDLMAKLSKVYVPTYVNAKNNAKLTARFRVKAYPTTIIVAPDNRIVDRIEGFVSAETLISRLERAEEKFQSVAARTNKKR